VRHGETELKSSERLWGSTDVKLDALGLRQAERLSDRLAGEKIDCIYSSNLQRALVTAKTIASKHQLEVITCAELREIDFGEMEGLTLDEVNRLYPEVVKLRKQRSPKLKYPGGESFVEFGKRVGKFLDRLEKHTDEETVLIVAHNGVLRVLLCQLLNLGLEHLWQFPLDLASLSVAETNRQGARLSLLNDVSHLT
jgi:broad specificity phosphatase PhoE